MQLSEIIHLKFIFELWFVPLQLGYITYQYDQIVHVEDFHQQIATRLFDVQRMIHLDPTKTLVDEESRYGGTMPSAIAWDRTVTTPSPLEK